MLVVSSAYKTLLSKSAAEKNAVDSPSSCNASEMMWLQVANPSKGRR